MNNIDLRRRLKESTEDVMVNTEEVSTEDTEVSDRAILSEATSVMDSYQKANKWLDIIKESALMDFGCVFFSDYVHKLAHTMPMRFDTFGDILHTLNMKVPYPATEYIDNEPKSLSECIDKVISILEDICSTLESFIDTAPRPAAIAAESLLDDISKEFTNLYWMQRALNVVQGDNLEFDKWVAEFVNNLDNLA